MTSRFASPLADDLEAFLAFKRALGYKYRRPEHTLLRFDRFVCERIGDEAKFSLDRLVLDWLSSMEGCKPASVAGELRAVRQFCLYLRRRDPDGFVPGHGLVPQSAQAPFLPHIFSLAQIQMLLALAASLRGAPFRPLAMRSLILVLYCTGLRIGEAVRLRLRDVDLDEAVFFIDDSKGRSRLVPFGEDLAVELRGYLDQRNARAPTAPDSRFFVLPDGAALLRPTASEAVRRLLRRAGLKPPKGRVGPRPYDFRHTFAVHRLTRWYQEGADVHARLPWLSAYMGHYDLMGTERYLTATPELLALAADRFEARLARTGEDNL